MWGEITEISVWLLQQLVYIAQLNCCFCFMLGVVTGLQLFSETTHVSKDNLTGSCSGIGLVIRKFKQ